MNRLLPFALIALHALDALPATADIVNGTVGESADHYITRLVPFGFSGDVLVASGHEVFINKGFGLRRRVDHPT